MPWKTHRSGCPSHSLGLYVRERFVEVRRQFVSEAPDDPDMPGIDAIAHCLNDTIAELDPCGRCRHGSGEARSTRPRHWDNVVATKTAGVDAVNLQSASDRTTEDIQQLETALRSVPVNVHIDQSRHYQLYFLNFKFNQATQVFREDYWGAQRRILGSSVGWIS